MYELCCFALLFYYPLTIFLLAKKPEKKHFYHSVVFPLPILIFLAAWAIEEADEGNFTSIARYMIFFSTVIGLGVLIHCYLEWQAKEPLFNLRILAACIMLVNPLLLYYPDHYSIMLGLFFFAGMLMGFYGNVAMRSGKLIGLVYIYCSAVSMILIPALTYALTEVYADFVKRIIIYRRAPDGMSCHAPPYYPIIPEWDSLKIPVVLSSIYTGLVMVQGRIMRLWLVRDMQGNGTLPQEYLSIVRSRDQEPDWDTDWEDVKWKEELK